MKPVKYNEDLALKDFSRHIEGTYGEHYVGNDKNIQVQDLIQATGHAESFYIGNILKYVARYGKKRGKNPDDLLKAAHYLCLLYALNHIDDDTPTDNEPTLLQENYDGRENVVEFRTAG